MRRRNFIALIGGATIMWPLSARAQKSAGPVVGVMLAGSPAQWDIPVFVQGLSEAGYIEGKNVAIEFRWAEGHDERLPAIAAELVSRHVAVLVASGGSNAVLAARAATSTIPIVFMTGADPVKIGLVASLGRPGGNVTGITFLTTQLDAKRLELLHELVPKASVIALLMDPDYPTAESNGRALQDAARSLGQQARILNARTVQEIDAAFAALVQLRASALLVASSSFFFLRREQLVALAARHAVPATFDVREFVTAGGLMSYGPSLPEVRRQAGIYTGKILNGAKPADLPVLQPTKFELVINGKTAKALGLTIPQSVLIRANEVIQ